MARRALRILAGGAALLWSAGAAAELVTVRFPEGYTHGFLALRAPGGEALAHGELIQTPRGDRVETRLTFRFRDGSLSDETIVFSQRGAFRLLSYRVVQRGRSFSHVLDAAMDRQTGRYTVRFREKPDSAETVEEGRLDLPPDVYNGMITVVLKNLPRGAQGSAHMVAFTPKPRVLKAELIPAGEDPFFVGDVARTAVRYLVKLEIGGLLGVAASLLGKDPPRLYYWIATGPVPAFVKFEGPLYAEGPVWRVELSHPRFPE